MPNEGPMTYAQGYEKGHLAGFAEGLLAGKELAGILAPPDRGADYDAGYQAGVRDVGAAMNRAT